MPTFGLDFSDIYERIQKFSNTKNIEGSATEAKNAANDALLKIAADRRWIALRRQGTITPATSTQSYALTGSSFTGFNWPVRVFYLLNGIEQPIRIVSEEEWAQKSDSNSDGTPSICAFLEISGATKLYLSLRPGAGFVAQHDTIYVDFDRKPTTLSADADVPEIPNTNNHLAIVYFAVADLILGQGDLRGAAGWEAKAREELDKAVVSDINYRGIKSKFTKPSFGVLTGINRQRPQRDYQNDYREHNRS